MKFGYAIDYYENEGVIYYVDNGTFHSMKGDKLQDGNIFDYIKSDWKLVGLEALNNFKSEDSYILKKVINEDIIFPLEKIYTLNNLFKSLFDSFWLKNNEKIKYNLEEILEFTKTYSHF